MPKDNRKFTPPENGKLSQGPKTAEGKQRSANTEAYAKKLLLNHEDPAQFHALHDDCLQRYRPEGRLEEQFVLDMAGLLWRKRRCAPTETALLDLKGASHRLRHQRLLCRQFQAMRAELAHLQNNRPPAAAPRQPSNPFPQKRTQLQPTRCIQTGVCPQPRGLNVKQDAP